MKSMKRFYLYTFGINCADENWAHGFKAFTEREHLAWQKKVRENPDIEVEHSFGSKSDWTYSVSEIASNFQITEISKDHYETIRLAFSLSTGFTGYFGVFPDLPEEIDMMID